MAYTRVNWQNSPSHATPLSAENLNVMDAAIEELDGAVTDAEGTISTLESTVSDQATTISGLQTTVGEHTADIGNMEDDISDLQTTVSGHTTSIGNLETSVGDNTSDISDLKEELEHISGISDDVKIALLQIASKVAYIDDDGQDYYDALYDALYPPSDLVSISAVYTQSGTVYDTDSLDSLKADLVVTALYDDQTTQTVTSYTLSGTLEEGTSTITVSYANKTTTFNVTVTHFADTSIHSWDFTQSLTDSQGGLTATLSDSGASRDSTGLHITSGSGYCVLGDLNPNIGIAIELDISSMSRQGSNHGRLLMKHYGSATTGSGDGLIYRSSGYWAFYLGAWSDSSGITDPDDFAGKTIRVEISSDGGTQKLYVDNVLKFTNTKAAYYDAWQIGSSSNSFYNITITGVRVYALEVE